MTSTGSQILHFFCDSKANKRKMSAHTPNIPKIDEMHIHHIC